MYDLIENMLSENHKIAKYQIQKYWLDIEQLDDYSLAQDVYEKHLKEQ